MIKYKRNYEMKKNFVTVTLIIVFIFGITAGYTGCFLVSSKTTAERFKEIYGMDLPDGMEKEFYWHENTGFASGKAAEYIVFKVQDDPTEIINGSSFIDYYERDYSKVYEPFLKGRDLEFEESFRKNVERFYPENCSGLKYYDKCSDNKGYHLELPEEYYPDWTEEYTFAVLYQDGLRMVYFPGILKLILFLIGH